MRNSFFWLELLFLGLAGLFALINTNLHNPFFTSAAILFFSVFLFVAGGEAIFTKKVGFFPRNPNFGRTETYQGLTAKLWGGIFIFMAVCTLALAIFNLTLKGGMEEFWSILLGTNWGWSIVLLCVGLVVLLIGIIRLIAGSGGYYTGLQDRVIRITGIIPALCGLALVILGLIVLLSPGLLINLANQIIYRFK